LEQELRAAGLGPEEARRLPGSDARIVAIARVSWEGTTVAQSWLAERLGMKSAANVSQQLRRQRAESEGTSLPSTLRGWLSSVKKC